jgi:hypothetical protein
MFCLSVTILIIKLSVVVLKVGAPEKNEASAEQETIKKLEH